MAKRPPTSLIGIQSLVTIKPLNDRQKEVFEHWDANYNLILSGSAGSGKSMLALYLGLKALLLKKCDKLIICRSIVPTRDIGFLKGTQEEKESVYEEPYIQLVSQLLPTVPNPYATLKKQESLLFKSTSFIRGTNIDNAVVIVDEFSNMTYHELCSVITRLGKNCRIIFSGDFYQSDLKYEDEKAGVLKFLKVLSLMNEDFARVDFGLEDIVRSGLVKRFLIAEDTLRQKS